MITQANMPEKSEAMSADRYWHTEMQAWVWDSEVNEALDAAQLAITEYHNGDRAWAEQWLIQALEANRKPAESYRR